MSGCRRGILAASATAEKEGASMPAMAAPLAAEKLDAWEAWVAELGGARKAEFEDMNARHGLTETPGLPAADARRRLPGAGDS
jgi:hypothetical protein